MGCPRGHSLSEKCPFRKLHLAVFRSLAEPDRFSQTWVERPTWPFSAATCRRASARDRPNQMVPAWRTKSGGRVARRDGPVARSTSLWAHTAHCLGARLCPALRGISRSASQGVTRPLNPNSVGATAQTWLGTSRCDVPASVAVGGTESATVSTLVPRRLGAGTAQRAVPASSTDASAGERRSDIKLVAALPLNRWRATVVDFHGPFDSKWLPA